MKIRLVLSLVLAATFGCRDSVMVVGSTCEVDADCDVHPSCALRQNSCSCRDQVCVFDASRASSTETGPGCRECHGSTVNAAPPLDTQGGIDTTLVSVGAHQVHLNGGLLSRPISCAECHQVPDEVDAPGHIDDSLPADVVFGTLASSDGAQPAWDVSTNQCDAYCHGDTLSGGSNTQPTWTTVDGSEAVCGSCHSLPPTDRHTVDPNCDLCHTETAGPNQTLINRLLHINGNVDVSDGPCYACHGDSSRPAPLDASPPTDLDGATDTPEVGAHLTHLQPINGLPVPCDACHVVPSTYSDPLHDDDGDDTAEVTFSGAAIGPGAPAPTYDSTTHTCQNVYCHGVTTTGGSNGDSVAFDAGNAAAACDACHGAPPTTPGHVGVTAATPCGGCHLHLSTTDPLTVTDPSLHVDGKVDVQGGGTCSSCHGDAARAAPLDASPPTDLAGSSSSAKVGAHLEHLQATDAAVVACDACHLVPAVYGNAGHNDDGDNTAEVIFSGRATDDGAAPTYAPGSLTCQNTYCHGATIDGGTNGNNVAFDDGAAAAACDACHGVPPGTQGHTGVFASTPCGGCHPNMSPTAAITVADASTHVDGTVDVVGNGSCSSCHGTSGRTPPLDASPPVDLAGSSSSTQVGAHLDHLQATTSAPVACDACHVVPNAYGDAGHNDDFNNLAEVIFSGLATQDGASPSYTPGSFTCQNTYCHGDTINGGTNGNSVAFDDGAAAAACDACHGVPPSTQGHLGVFADTPCGGCHPNTSVTTAITITNASTHVDGNLDVVGNGSCSSCHGNSGRTPPLDASPPVDLSGSSSSAQVGAHLNHLQPSDSLALACDDCHLVPAAYGDAGHNDDFDNVAEVSLGGLAGHDSSTPSYTPGSLTCQNTYCHGFTTTGGNNGDSVAFDDGAAASACDACHGAPPATAGHAAVIATTPCGGCHVNMSGTLPLTVTDPDLHVDGTKQFVACGGCHSNPPATGSHAAHVGTQGLSCTTCHGHDDGAAAWHNEGGGTVTSANVDIIFDTSISFAAGGTTMNNGGTASYDRPQQRCAVGCHNPRLGNPAETANLSNLVDWGAGQLECRACHDQVRAGLPYGHDVGSPDRAGCLECHAHASHPASSVQLRDPDPTDAYVPSTSGPLDPLCLTCHDAGGDTFFGGQAPRDVDTPWGSSRHHGAGHNCDLCHDYHASNGNAAVFTVATVANCIQSGCHDDKFTGPNGEFTLATHHPVGDVAPNELQCTHCHNPHADQAPPNAAANPANIWSSYSMPSTTASNRRSGSNTSREFCLACHTASPPAGVPGNPMDIAQVFSSGSEPSAFRDGGTGLHREKHGQYNCVSCHDWHGTDGNSNNNRLRLLLPYIDIDPGVPSPTYNDKNNCQFPSTIGRTWNGSWINFTFSCH